MLWSIDTCQNMVIYRFRSCDTGQQIAWFDRCQLIITWCHISKTYTLNQGSMSLSTCYLEYGCHVAQLHRRRRAYVPIRNTNGYDTWENQFMGFLYFLIWVWGSTWRPFGLPELRYKYALTEITWPKTRVQIYIYMYIYTQGSYDSWKTWKVLEFILWHFPGLESPGKRATGPGKCWKFIKLEWKFWNVWQTVRRINIEILGVQGLMWILESWKNQSES